MKSQSAKQTLIGSAFLIVSMLLLWYIIANMNAFGDEISYSTILLGIIIIGLLIVGFIMVLSADLKRQKVKRAQKIAAKEFNADELDELEAVKPSTRKATMPDPECLPPWEGRKIDYVVIAHSSDRIKLGSAATRGAVGGVVGGLLSSGLMAPVGIAAALTAKKKGYLDLVIHYKNGNAKTQRVKVNSVEYRSLARYIRA